MAYRRRRYRVGRRRRPLLLRRRRRIFRRRVVKPLGRGSMHAKLTRVSVETVNHKGTSVWNGAFSPTDFKEFNRLIHNFESCTFRKFVIRVIPWQNVANNSTSSVPLYCIVPWHRPETLSADWDAYTSIDRAKIRSQVRPGRQMWVPNICQPGYTAGQENKTFVNSYLWKPVISRNFTTESTYPTIFGGLVAFQGDPSFEAGMSKFTIIVDAYVTFNNQNIFGV
ncbi:putative capsid protein [Bat associated cyclovirus 3]|uniref:Putative capsid protein n=1 Tax=Bat associated cyclovirus 3 TaxID=2050586 RepID=G1D7G7_9CIRC|nr:putative capsid protein [Bat associated cyclovirus 3]AEL87791.1 putative capsid protein [Bat associated cyclovirus 3]